MERKALFFDIDGTLLSEKTGEVPLSAKEALEKARERGHLTFINTGRTIACIPYELKQIRFSGWLCGCGTYIQYGDEVLMARSIPHERGRQMIQMMKTCGAEMILEGQEDCYMSIRRSRFDRVERSRRYFKSMGLAIETYIENDNFDFDKFVIYTDQNTSTERLFMNLGRDMEIIDRLDGMYEIVPKGYSKGTAIEYILKYFGMEKEDAYVFGDSSNDLPMFQYAEHTIAMGVHDRVLDPYTEFVAAPVEEDGLSGAMKHYGLI